MGRTKKRILIPALLLCGLLLCSCKKQGTEIVLEHREQAEDEAEKEEQDVKEEETESPEETKKEPAFIWIDISGAVRQPGVYKLPENARLFEAVEAAGGFTEQADAQWLNQAKSLTDGEKIQVYTREETEKLEEQGLLEENTAVQQETAGKVNINTASLEGLQEIPGIGEVRARAILDYRQEVGRFQAIEEIQQVPGIKGKTYEKIADYISVE